MISKLVINSVSNNIFNIQGLVSKSFVQCLPIYYYIFKAYFFIRMRNLTKRFSKTRDYETLAFTLTIGSWTCSIENPV